MKNTTDTMTLTELQSLSPDELRVRVAELMGWTPMYPNGPHDKQVWIVSGGSSQILQNCRTLITLPPYPTSLDFCREFEDAMTDEEQDRYIDALLHVIVVPAEAEFGVALSDTDTMWVLIHATALQKCQAYILTKGVQ